MKAKRYHIIFDVQNVDQKLLGRKIIKEILLELPLLINMSILKGPVISAGVPQNPGFSGFILVDFSHISIHSFSKYNEILVDVFSCKSYNKQKVIQYLIKEFQTAVRNVQVKTVAWG